MTTSTSTAGNLTYAIGGDLPVYRLGYGAMRLCGQPGNFGPYADWQGGKELLKLARTGGQFHRYRASIRTGVE